MLARARAASHVITTLPACRCGDTLPLEVLEVLGRFRRLVEVVLKVCWEVSKVVSERPWRLQRFGGQVLLEGVAGAVQFLECV